MNERIKHRRPIRRMLDMLLQRIQETKSHLLGRTTRGRTSGVPLVALVEAASVRAPATTRSLPPNPMEFCDIIDELIHDVVIVMDCDAVIQEWNRGAERTLGLARADAVGQPLDMLPVFVASGPLFDEVMTRVRRTGRWCGELPFGREDGRKGVIETVIVAREDEFGSRAGYIFVARDITQLKEMQRERPHLESHPQHAQNLESLGVLAGGIAHDFNNLLQGIVANASLLLMDLEPDSPAWQCVKDIDTAALRAACRANQMLAYSGKQALNLRPLDLSTLVEERAHVLEGVVSRSTVVDFDLQPGTCTIQADTAQINQVVMNLIMNASEAIGDVDGLITVVTGTMIVDQAYLSEACLGKELPEGKYAYLRVSDTGCGIDEETKARMFDPYFTTKFTGRGLGLAEAFGIVKGHQGAVMVDSKPGEGTSITVMFPAVESTVAGNGRASLAIGTGHEPGKILVTDDEELVRSVAKSILERFGFGVIMASSGDEALELFHQHTGEIALVLLDMTMPEKNGEETFLELRRCHEHVPVLFTSGYHERDPVAIRPHDSQVEFIQKPYRPTELINKIREMLNH